jgi:hypothetical protein
LSVQVYLVSTEHAAGSEIKANYHFCSEFWVWILWGSNSHDYISCYTSTSHQQARNSQSSRQRPWSILFKTWSCFAVTARIWEFIELSTKKRIRQRLFNTYMIILNIRMWNSHIDECHCYIDEQDFTAWSRNIVRVVRNVNDVQRHYIMTQSFDIY